MSQNQKDPTHSANFGVGLQGRCRESGITCDIIYPGAPGTPFESPTDYLIQNLRSLD